MASRVGHKDMAPTLSAAREWIGRCLIDDGSVLSDKRLWTAPFIDEVRRAFVDHPDDDPNATFMDKLQGQLKAVSAAARQLAAEMIWSLLLFPSNNSPDIKRRHVLELWERSGEPLRPRGHTFDDDVLKGIGSGGAGYNNNRPRELTFLINAAESLKQRSEAERHHILNNYDAFIEWIDTIPSEGRRQFPHMLRYFAFPDRVERMSSNGDRYRVLEAFGVAPRRETKAWSDRQLDDAMLALRKSLEQQHPGAILDFYDPPLVATWNSDDVSGSGGPDVAEPPVRTDPPRVDTSPGPEVSVVPRNLILYGPPGTGKTYWLRAKCEEYTDRPEQVDRDTWLLELIRDYGWRSVTAAALADLRRGVRVPELWNHPIVQAKARQRGRTTSVLPNLWSNLQQHTPESVSTVNYAARRPPFIFSKRSSGEWELLPEWREEDAESADLFAAYQRGPSGASQPVHRFRVVTFHPSFSYEDFIRGIRPVVTSEDGATQFRVVDGVFKRIADEARANSTKRYALFIDEINRANIAKVFGELITLIEVDKRVAISPDGSVLSGMEVDLPGSQDDDAGSVKFGVPANLDIYGTMNTADRSIAMLDVALRRRFEFQEMEPQPDLLGQVIDGVEVSRVLRRINDRLEYLLDRDHRIGHAYLMHTTSLDDLRRAFHAQIIPLLQEYFFDDLGRVAAVLTTAPGATPFVAAQTLRAGELFPKRLFDDAPLERVRYVVTPSEGWTADSFKGLYLDVMQLHGTATQG
jgi:5-methylcytosine-specific restriction enzyme B